MSRSRWDDKSSRRDDNDISSFLEHQGLDTAYWSPIFQTFGIINLKVLQYVDERTFHKILKKKRFQFEVYALAGLFNADNKKWRISEEPTLTERLDEYGLHKDTWIPIFEAHGLNSSYALKHVDEETFREIVDKRKFPFEAFALAELFEANKRNWKIKSDSISAGLDNVGLDKTTWIPILASFGITTMKKIQYVDKQTFREIAKKRNFPYEVHALMELFVADKKWNIDKDNFDKSIDAILKNANLNREYWLRKFQYHGLVDGCGLEYADEETLHSLLECTRFRWEKNALMKIFKTVQNSWCVESTDRGTPKLDEFVNNDEISHSRNPNTDLKFEKDVVDIIKSLDGLEETSFQNQEIKRALLEKLKMSIQQRRPILRKTLSHFDLIRTISSGSVIKGHYMMGDDIEKSAIPRGVVLEPPSNVSILLPSLSETFVTREFFDQATTDIFKTIVDHGGISIASSFRKNITSNNILKSSDEETTRSYVYKHQFVEAYQMLFVPVASFSLEQNKCHLSEPALERLKHIETLGSVNDKDASFIKECHKFFDEFGSHLYMGTYHFGGRYTWQVKCSYSTTADTDEALKMAKLALSGSVSGGTAWLSERTMNTAQSDDVDMLCKFAVEKNLYKHGGPREVDVVNLWKSGLVQCNSSWTVIDKDSTKLSNFCGVWDLIENHKFEFKDSSFFARKIEKVWQSAAEQHAK